MGFFKNPTQVIKKAVSGGEKAAKRLGSATTHAVQTAAYAPIKIVGNQIGMASQIARENPEIAGLIAGQLGMENPFAAGGGGNVGPSYMPQASSGGGTPQWVWIALAGVAVVGVILYMKK